MKVTTRLSIPRHNMVDIRSDQAPAEHHQTQSRLRQSNLRRADHQELQSETRCNETKAGSIGNSQRNQLASLTENSRATINSKKHNASEMKEMFVKGLDEPEYSQMNHEASFRRLTKTLERRASEQMSVNPTEKYQASLNSPVSFSQAMLVNSRHDSRDFNEEDHLAEIENIFSYLAEEEKDMGEPTSPITGFQNSPQSQDLLSRPSLRYRRDVRCPKLVIANNELDTEEKPAPLKRRLTMPCIMKYGAVGPVAGRGTGLVMAATSNGTLCVSGSKVIETIVIDNGVRKHLEEEMEYHPPSPPSDIDPVEEILEPPKELPKRYRLESVKLSKKAELGSLPNVSLFRRLEGRAIPRHEAEMLCQQKKEELQQLKELEDELRKRALVLKIGVIKVFAFTKWHGKAR